MIILYRYTIFLQSYQKINSAYSSGFPQCSVLPKNWIILFIRVPVMFSPTKKSTRPFLQGFCNIQSYQKIDTPYSAGFPHCSVLPKNQLALFCRVPALFSPTKKSTRPILQGSRNVQSYQKLTRPNLQGSRNVIPKNRLTLFCRVPAMFRPTKNRLDLFCTVPVMFSHTKKSTHPLLQVCRNVQSYQKIDSPYSAGFPQCSVLPKNQLAVF
jgi:hypothetical protein